MAIQQIQKSSVFKPDMIGDLVEITAYKQADGSLSTMAGILAAYHVTPDGTVFKIEGVDSDTEIVTEGNTINITHYEYVIDIETRRTTSDRPHL